MKFALPALTIALALAAPVLSYGNDVDCSAQFSALSGAIDGAKYTNDRDPMQLQGKVTEASGKLALDKYADSEQKLVDISDKVKALRDARKPKIFDDTATLSNEIEAILDAVDDALTCIPGGLDSLPH